jgi:hypothetical protein
MAEKKSVVELAKSRFERAKGAYSTLRQQAIEDTRFVLGDSDNNWQWPGDVYESRATVARKPCLTINITAQHCNQIENQIRQNRPTAKVVPVDSNADVKTAEILGGMLRAIQSYSNADTAHDIAAMHSLYGGEGFWRVLTEYESESSFDQVISIRPLVNPQLVYIDPDAIEPDRSDARWGILFEDIPRAEYENESDDNRTKSLGWGEDGANGWNNKDTVRRAEYFWREDVEDTLYLLETGETVSKSELPEGAKVNEAGKTITFQGEAVLIQDSRKTTRKQWKWCKIVGGSDEPEEEKDWPGSFMPIICVVGKEVNVNGEVVRKGLVRDLKDSARMVNYSYSAAVETVALQTKTPWLASSESVEGHEDVWGASNIENRAWLPWNAYDAEGQQLPKPERVQPAVMATAQVQMLQLSVEQMRAASGQHNANFGVKSDAQSGVGIQRLKQQGEVATFHFPDNLARGLKYEATVILDLIPKVYDRARIVRILGLDGKEEAVKLDPQHQGEPQKGPQDSGFDQVFNPSAGRYDVAIDTGPSYQTQRQESAAILGDMASRTPILMQAAPDLVFKAMDFPMANEIAERLGRTVPAQIKGDDGDGQQQMQMQLQQMQQALQELQAKDQQGQQVIGKMQQHIDKLEIERRGDVVRNQGAIQLERMKQQTAAAKGVSEHGIKAYDAQTDRVKTLLAMLTPIEIQALAAQTIQETLAAQPLQPEMDNPTIPIPINPMDGQLPMQGPSGPFSLGEQPPAMDATGAQPGPAQADLSEGNPNV